MSRGSLASFLGWLDAEEKLRPRHVDELTLHLALRVRSVNAWGSRWERARKVQEQRYAVHHAWRKAAPGERLYVRFPCEVQLVRLGPQFLDDDNLRPALKAVRDQVAVELGLPQQKRGRKKGFWPVADDKDPRVSWTYDQRREKTHGVEIHVRHVPEGGRAT